MWVYMRWFMCQFQKGHVLRTVFTCRRCHRQRTWSSSRILSGHYLVNQKLVVCLLLWRTCIVLSSHIHRLIHAFTSAGMLLSQYINFSVFSGIGNVGHGYITQGCLWFTCMCYMSINVLLFSSIQSPCLYRDSGSLGTAFHANSSRRNANSPRVLHKRRGKVTLAKHVVCVMFDTGQ